MFSEKYRECMSESGVPYVLNASGHWRSFSEIVSLPTVVYGRSKFSSHHAVFCFLKELIDFHEMWYHRSLSLTDSHIMRLVSCDQY